MAKDTRAKILTAAAKVFLQEGYEVSVRKITAAAGVSNGSFFHLFPTKQDLAAVLREQILAERRVVVTKPFLIPAGADLDAVPAAVAAYLRWSAANASQVRLLRILPSDDPAGDGMTGESAGLRSEIEAIDSWARPLSAKGTISPLSGVVLHALIFGPAELVVRQWLQAASAENPLSLAEGLGEAAWTAIKAKPAPSSGRSRRPTRLEPVAPPQSMFNL